MHHRVVGKPPGHKPVIVIRYFLHQHILHGSHIPAAQIGSPLLHQGEQAVKPFLHHRLRHLVLHGSRRGSRALGVDKGKCAVKAHLFHHVKGIRKVFLRLSGKSHNDIRGQRDPRHCLFNFLSQG